MKWDFISRGEKEVLDISPETRQHLAQKIGFEFSVKGEYYTIDNLNAESSSNDTAGGAVIGGLLGLLGGGTGVIVGGIAGGIIGGIRIM